MPNIQCHFMLFRALCVSALRTLASKTDTDILRRHTGTNHLFSDRDDDGNMETLSYRGVTGCNVQDSPPQD